MKSVLLFLLCVGSVQAESVGGVSQISVETDGLLVIEQGDDESVTIDGPLSQRQAVELRRDGDKLLLLSEGLSPDLVVRLTLVNPAKMQIRRASRVQINDMSIPRLDISVEDEVVLALNHVQTDRLRLDARNHARVVLNNVRAGEATSLVSDHASLLAIGSDFEQLVVSLSAYGSAEFSGAAKHEKVNADGYASFDGRKLQAEHARISLKDYAMADVWAKATLDVSKRDFGHVKYSTVPQQFGFADLTAR